MSAERALARLWAGRSVFEEGAEAGEGFPFALHPSSPVAGPEAGAAPLALPARPLLSIPGMPPARVPFILDASSVEPMDAKGWAAIARGAAAAGAAIIVSPRQLAQRGAVLKASSAPLLLRAAPGEPTAPEAAGAAAALLAPLVDARGGPAVLAEDALPGLVEALRALSGYRLPVLLAAPPGRVPRAAALAAAAAAGASGLLLEEPRAPREAPFAAMVGAASSVRAMAPSLPVALAAGALSDGAQMACALAAGSGALSTALPLRVALAEETRMSADWKAVGDQLGAAVRVLWEDAQRASALAGVRDPRDLGGENLRALTYDAAALSGAPLAGYDARLPWWPH